MKTTLNLDDDLLIEAKAVAARRRTTLKELVTRSLRREIGREKEGKLEMGETFEVGPLGTRRLRARGGKPMTNEECIASIKRAELEDDLNRAFPPAEP
jgi:hypothetical protein